TIAPAIGNAGRRQGARSCRYDGHGTRPGCPPRRSSRPSRPCSAEPRTHELSHPRAASSDLSSFRNDTHDSTGPIVPRAPEPPATSLPTPTSASTLLPPHHPQLAQLRVLHVRGAPQIIRGQRRVPLPRVDRGPNDHLADLAAGQLEILGERGKI